MVLLLGVVVHLRRALFVAFAAIGGLTSADAGRQPLAQRARGADRRAPSRCATELDRPFADRVLAPLLGRVQGLSAPAHRRPTPATGSGSKLDLAGNPPG